MKILVIEDEKLLADSIKEMLERKGFQVEAVYDGEAGKEYAELGIYDLLILDVMMPKMDGGKESGSLDNIQPGTFVTVTVSGKGKATYVLVSSQSFFGGGRGFTM